MENADKLISFFAEMPTFHDDDIIAIDFDKDNLTIEIKTKFNKVLHPSNLYENYVYSITSISFENVIL